MQLNLIVRLEIVKLNLDQVTRSYYYILFSLSTYIEYLPVILYLLNFVDKEFCSTRNFQGKVLISR